MSTKMRVSTVEFFVDNKRVRFKVINNLPYMHALSLGDALDSWLARTTDYTAKSFCDYIKSKELDFTCVQATKKNMENHFGKGAIIHN